MDVRELARTMSAHMVRGVRTRSRAEYLYLEDTAPEWASAVADAAHGDMMPDDWRYQMLDTALYAIAEGNDPDEVEPPVYTHDLLQWLASHLDRVGYVDEAMSEAGVIGTPEQNITTFIAWGWLAEFREVYELTLAALEEVAETQED